MSKVTFKDTGDEIEAAKGAELKDVTKDNGWPIAYGCEDGVCGTCIVKVEEGQDNLSPKEEVEDQTLEMMCMNDGEHRLCCQCKVNGDITIKGM
jgi:ferredoxin